MTLAQREHRDGRFEAEGGAPFVLHRQCAGQQRHDHGGGQQAARDAAADAVAASRAAIPASGRSVRAPVPHQQQQQRGVHRHVGECEQRLAAEHVARESDPADQQGGDGERLVQQRRASRRPRRSATDLAGRSAAPVPAPCAPRRYLDGRREWRPDDQLLEVHVPAGGVAQQHGDADGRRPLPRAHARFAAPGAS